MITIKQLEELINNTDDTKTIKYVDENKRTITPNENSIIENIDYTKDFKEGPFGDVYKTNYTITINNNKTNMSNHLDDPQKGLEKHFKISEETGYYDYHTDDFENILKDFKVYDGTPTLHAYSNYDHNDHRITIFKQDDFYYAYVVKRFEYGSLISSYIIKNTDYTKILQDLNEKIHSDGYWYLTKILI